MVIRSAGYSVLNWCTTFNVELSQSWQRNTMDIYSREEIAEQKDMRKHAKTAMVIVSAVAVVFCIVLMCLVNPVRSMRFRVFASVALSVAGCFDIYMMSFVLPYMRPRPKKRTPAGKVLKVLSNILHQLHIYVIWIILAVMLASFLFNLVTDTTAAKKVTIFVDVETLREAELETMLNNDLPEGIKMTKVHPFTYSVFGMNTVGGDDIYIVKESDIEKYLEGFAPLSEFIDVPEGRSVYISEGIAYGIFYRPDASQMGPVLDYDDVLIDWDPKENYYLFFGKNGLHPGKDGAAAYIARKLLAID